MELQTGEIPREISVDDLRLRIREIIRRGTGVLICEPQDTSSLFKVLYPPLGYYLGVRALVSN